MTGLAPDDITRMRDQLFFDGPERNRRLSRFWLLLPLAAVIASAGVVSDSTATVIGAMIVAPLMTPILGIVLPRIALVAVVGALLTALGFGVGGRAWGLVVLAAFVVTVLAGLTVKYGLHRFTAGLLLNIWFLIAVALPAAYRLDHVHTNAWAQALAWLIGSALTIAYTTIMWLARGRTAQLQPGADVLPGDITPVKLTNAVILYVLIRAIAVSIAVAIAFGLHLPNADWMPVATLVAMKPSLQQSALIAEQRLAGAILGAAVAALFLLTVDPGG